MSNIITVTSLAKRLTNNYALQLINNLGSDIRANGEYANIFAFINGLLSANLYNNLTEMWMLKSSQNVGQRNRACGFLGNNGTLVNSPLWQTNGLNFSATNKSMTTSVKMPLAPTSMIIVLQPGDTQNNNEVIRTGGVNVSGNQYSIGKSGGNNYNLTANGNSWPPGYNVAQRLNFGTYSTSAFVFIMMNVDSTAFTGRCSANATYNTLPNGTSNTQGFNDTPAPINFNINTVVNLPIIPVIMLFKTNLSDASTEIVRSLYKSTIGQNLGLP